MSGGFRESIGIEHAGNVGGNTPAGGAVERDPAAGGVVSRRAFWGSLDRARVARGAHQRSLVPIRRDQNQCFRRTVLLDAPASHWSALPAGVVPMNGNPAPFANVRKRAARRKGMIMRHSRASAI